MLNDTFNLLMLFPVFLSGLILGSFVTSTVNRIISQVNGLTGKIPADELQKSMIRELCRPLTSPIHLFNLWNMKGNRIDFRNTVSEIFLGVMTTVLFMKLGFTVIFFLYTILFMGLLAIFRIDQEMMVIPDLISIPLLVTGLVASLLGYVPGISWMDSLFGILLGAIILYAPAKIFEYARGTAGLGGGDVKFLAMIGAWVSMKGVLFTLFVAALTGFVFSLYPIFSKGSDAGEPIPFGPYLASAAMLYILIGADLVEKLARFKLHF